jgi:hypothetical protein
MATTISGHPIRTTARAAPKPLIPEAATGAAGVTRWLTGPALDWAQRTTIRVRSRVLQISGMGAITYAVWGWQPQVGYAVGGVALLALEWLFSD